MIYYVLAFLCNQLQLISEIFQKNKRVKLENFSGDEGWSEAGLQSANKVHWAQKSVKAKKKHSPFCLNSGVPFCLTHLVSPSILRYMVGNNARKFSAVERHFLWKDSSAQDVQTQQNLQTC